MLTIIDPETMGQVDIGTLIETGAKTTTSIIGDIAAALRSKYESQKAITAARAAGLADNALVQALIQQSESQRNTMLVILGVAGVGVGAFILFRKKRRKK